MNILYLTKGDHVDYQNDCLLIGLKEMFGSTVVDYNKQHHNYKSYCPIEAKKLYGMGMTVTRVLDDLEVDRTDITSKIKNKFFDLIVYGSIWRCNDYLQEILKFYAPNQIIAIDGEDECNIHPCFRQGVLYFKRELILDKRQRLFPISFAFPTSKLDLTQNKSRDDSYITPLDTSTYIYKDEESYYKDYNQSRFAVTIKKAGWDCLRHYEILGNGCIPVFLNIEKCPTQTMVNFPKVLCIEILDKLMKGFSKKELYETYWEKFKTHFIEKNTTEALAKYLINTLKQYTKIRHY